MSPRRSTKEPRLAPNSPLAPLVEQLEAMVRGLGATTMPDADDETAAYVRGRVEGIESAITLVRRAGALHVVTDEGQRLVRLERPAPAEDATLASRVTRLEREVQALRSSLHGAGPPKAMPAILEKPKERGGRPFGRCENALLTVLAQRHGRATTSQQLAILSGYSISSSGFANALGALRSGGLASGPASDIRITAEGVAAAGEVSSMPRSGRALVEYWGTKLPRAERVMLQEIVHAGAKGLDREGLSSATGYSLTSSGFANAIGKLRTLQLVEPGWPARAAATFLEGH